MIFNLMIFNSILLFQVTQFLTSYYEFLLPSATRLNYWGTHNTENHLLTDVSCGPSRKLQTIDEIFLVLNRLRCNVLEKDFSDRFSIDFSTISQILTTWINFLYFNLKQLAMSLS